MRKLLFFVLLTFCFAFAAAQNMSEVVYLKNGSMIRGMVIEEIPGQSIKIKTADGSVFVYRMSEVSKITREEVKKDDASTTSDCSFQKWAFDGSVSALMGIGKSKGTTIAVEAGLFKRVQKNLALGLTTGAYIPTESGAKVAIPITFHSQFMFPLHSSSIVPFADLSAGYVFSTGDITTTVGKKTYTSSIPDNIVIQLMPGIILPLGSGSSLKAGFGYCHMFTTKGGGSSDALALKIGFNLFKNTSTNKPRKPRNPTRNEGLQFTWEGGFMGLDQIGKSNHPYDGPFGNIVATYKMDPKISLGAGVGYEYISSSCEDVATDLFPDVRTYRLFARGVYRFIDKAVSPFGCFDVGVNYMKFKSSYEPDYDNVSKNSGIGFLISPALGLSFRVAPNSYLELKVGYAINTKTLRSYRENITDAKKFSTSAPYISLGFTHTFKTVLGWIKK